MDGLSFGFGAIALVDRINAKFIRTKARTPLPQMLVRLLSGRGGNGLCWRCLVGLFIQSMGRLLI
ncbi:MAG: hypothetical protein KAF91_22005 [Nostoc sp. TH1S01]|nr:hypothetical protein [Nostoc sp. TH1S01]